MSLDRTKLQKVRELGNGGWQAQCPACAESGQDRKGEHLRISSEGKFGCCVFAGDHEHRKRIFALAGDHGPKIIRVRVAPAKTASTGQLDLLGRLGRVFEHTGDRVKNGECGTGQIAAEVGTLGTCFQDPRAYAEKQSKDDLSIRKLIGSQEPVRSVPTVQHQEQLETGVPSVPKKVRLPYLTESGDLVIPFNSPERFHWWKRKGQSIRRTRSELMERKENDAAPF